MRHLYLAATGMNRGKTTASLGLLDGFLGRGLEVGFTKPVGQRTVIQDGVPADEDAVLMQSVFGLPDPLSVMSPVHIPRGFTKAYIDGEVVEDLGDRLRAAHATLGDREVVLIEGTGHAGVGAVVGLSNASVAAMLDAPAVIVSEGGVGRPIDEIVLNAALFARHGVEVAGAIVNKVDLDAQPRIERYLGRGLARHGIDLLGILPYRPILSSPTLAMVLEGLRAEPIWPGPDLDKVIDGVAVAAMSLGHVLERMGPGTLVIVPADREDVILAIASTHLIGPRTVEAVALEGRPLRDTPAGGWPDAGAPATPADAPPEPQPAGVGLILTGGYRPGGPVLEAIRRADMFAALVETDTYRAASDVHDLLVKTHPGDAGKIELIKRLVAEHLDVDRILSVARAPRA
ncbi:MAG TPA: AAA family ATPase [Candidatus Limnocylindrales bacterium]